MKIITPPKLKKGEKVGIVSPSNTIQNSIELYEQASKDFENKLGVRVITSKNALGKHYYSSGTVEERLHDIHSMFADNTIRAVIFSVGGDTAVELVDRLDYSLIQHNPKIFAGISDATTLLSAVFVKTGLITFHGIEFFDFASKSMEYVYDQILKGWFNGTLGEYSQNPNWRELEGGETRYSGWRAIRKGKASGRLVGGNFSSFYQLLNTEYSFSFNGSILFMETYKFSKKMIHKALVDLRLQGVFDQISGFILGFCLGSDDPAVVGNEREIGELLLEVTEGYAFPILHIGEIGHHVENLLLPIGAKARMDADKLEFMIEERVVL